MVIGFYGDQRSFEMDGGLFCSYWKSFLVFHQCLVIIRIGIHRLIDSELVCVRIVGALIIKTIYRID